MTPSEWHRQFGEKFAKNLKQGVEEGIAQMDKMIKEGRATVIKSSMTDERVIELMKAEVKCIERQDTEACKRNREHTCANCDLVQDTDELLNAYDKVIALLNKSLIRKRHTQEVFEEARAEINAERQE